MISTVVLYNIILGILGILVGILGYTTFNLLRKNEKAEDIIISQSDFIDKFSQQLDNSEKRLNEIDEKGVFGSDDEIGWFFNEVKQLQNDLSRFKTDQ